MTQNLRIINIGISYSNSDMTSGSYSIPASDSSVFRQSYFGNEYSVNGAYLNSDERYGGYYTWATVSAGNYNISDGETISSICPKNWKLPSLDDYTQLKSKYNSPSTEMQKQPANFYPSGRYNSSTITPGVGTWWTSTAYNGAIGNYYQCCANSFDEYSITGYYRAAGQNARCIQK